MRKEFPSWSRKSENRTATLDDKVGLIKKLLQRHGDKLVNHFTVLPLTKKKIRMILLTNLKIEKERVTA